MDYNDPEVMKLIQFADALRRRSGMQEELAAYDALGPEGLQEHVALGSSGERRAVEAAANQEQQALLNQQLEALQRRTQPSGRQYSSLGGAVFGGLGDGVRGLAGQLGAKDIARKQELAANVGKEAQMAALDKDDAARLAFHQAHQQARIEALKRWAAQQPGPNQAPSAQSQGGFGMPQLQVDSSLF